MEMFERKNKETSKITDEKNEEISKITDEKNEEISKLRREASKLFDEKHQALAMIEMIYVPDNENLTIYLENAKKLLQEEQNKSKQLKSDLDLYKEFERNANAEKNNLEKNLKKQETLRFQKESEIQILTYERDKGIKDRRLGHIINLGDKTLRFLVNYIPGVSESRKNDLKTGIENISISYSTSVLFQNPKFCLYEITIISLSIIIFLIIKLIWNFFFSSKREQKDTTINIVTNEKKQ